MKWKLPLLLLILTFSLLTITPTLKVTAATATITVDPSTTLHSNKFVMGYQLDYGISYWASSSTAQQYAQTNNYRFVRFHEHRLGKVCSYWNEGTQTGTFDWTDMDNLIQDILDTGGVPLIALGFYSPTYDEITSCPSGMTRNYGGTGLPNPDQFAAYAVDWMEHFNNVGLNVSYYEIFNEPFQYFGWGGSDTQKRGYFGTFYNTVATAMKNEDSTVKVGNDCSMMANNGLSSWMASNLDYMDFLSWHAYLTGSFSVSDSFFIDKSENDEGASYGGDNFIDPARQVWYDAGWGWLNCINTEENLSWAWQGGQEPRMRELINAVCQGLRTRMYVLNSHVLSSTYFHFAHGTTGYFGMVNFNNDYRYYPYWLHNMVHSDEVGRLSVGDSVTDSSSSHDNFACLSWKHNGHNTVLIIHKTEDGETVDFSGLSGTYDYWLLDSTQESLQTGTVNVASGSLTASGYAVFVIREQTADDPPSYQDMSYNTTTANNPCLFSLNVTDDNGLGGFYFGHNNSGTWSNETFTGLAGTQDWANITVTLNNTNGMTIRFRWYFNDSIDQWTTTTTYSLVTATGNIPQFSDEGTNTNIAGQNATFSVYWQDIEGLSGYIFGTNNTGSWINETWLNIGAGNPKGAWSQTNKTLNNTAGVAVEWTVWCNDTSNNWGSTGAIILITEQEYTPNLQYFNTQTLLDLNENLEYNGNPHLTYSNATVTGLDYAWGSQLSVSLNASGTSTTTIDTEGRGTPVTVSNGGYSYDATTDMLTLTVEHNSEEDVVISWETLETAGATGDNFYVGADVEFKISSVNNTYILDEGTVFYRIKVNSTHLWLDKSYTDGYYTRYAIWVSTPDNVTFTILDWFATEDSYALLRLDTPSSTAVTLHFHSPNLELTPYSSGTVSESYSSSTQTLEMTCNTDTSSTIRINVRVNETEEANITPENVGVEITDMEGCGNWVFSEESYYTFKAQYWDGNGYNDLDVCELAFTDDVNWINASYNAQDSEYILTSGNDVAQLQGGTVTIIDGNSIYITFLIRLKNTILDAYDVDIYLQCNDTKGALDDWDLLATDYFNIYSLGGHSTLETYGNASRRAGGDIFELYAYANDSWAYSTVTYRNLQHIKLLPMIHVRTPGYWLDTPSITYTVDYCTDEDDWITGLKLVLKQRHAYTYGVRYWNWTAEWYIHGSSIRNDSFWTYYEWFGTNATATTQLWIDLWFNKVNASSIIGGRINSYYFPMEDGAHDWLKWLTGSNWGIFEELRKQSMAFTTMIDDDGETLHTQQIKLVRIGCNVSAGTPDTYVGNQYIMLTDYDIFDLTIGGEPFTGIQTPVFDETKVAVMPQGGFLGALWSGLQYVAKVISDAMGPVMLDAWDTLVGFLDTIATWLGFPNAFSNFVNWVTSLWGWMGTSFNSLISILTPTFNLLSAFLTKFLNTLSTAFGIFAQFFTQTWGILDSTRDYGTSLWNLIRLDLWVQLFFILYPLYLFAIWDRKGFDAMLNHIRMVLNILSYIGRVFITVIEGTLALIGRLIESIPIVE